MQATRTQSTTFHHQFHFQPLIDAGSGLLKADVAVRDAVWKSWKGFADYIHLVIEFVSGEDCMELSISCANVITDLWMEILIWKIIIHREQTGDRLGKNNDFFFFFGQIIKHERWRWWWAHNLLHWSKQKAFIWDWNDGRCSFDWGIRVAMVSKKKNT